MNTNNNDYDYDYEQLATSICDDFFNKKDYTHKLNLVAVAGSRDKFMDAAKSVLEHYESVNGQKLSDKETQLVLENIRKNIFGYGPIDDLIQANDVTDIQLLGPKNVRIKRNGKRCGSDVTFADADTYNRCVNTICERNNVNLCSENAIPTLIDTTQDNYVLRINILSGLLTDNSLSVVQIRKISKNKPNLRILNNAGMFRHNSTMSNPEQFRPLRVPNIVSEEDTELNALFNDLITSKGIIFTGKGSSGKSTFVNAMITEIPKHESVMICQENAELFDVNHPGLFAAHVLSNAGDSKITYKLSDLIKAAQRLDVDRIIVADINGGSEAAALSEASMAGYKCWTSIRADSCEKAIDKMVYYISQATGRNTKESLKQLQGFEYVVHLKDFKLYEILRIRWDKERDTTIIEKVYSYRKDGM